MFIFNGQTNHLDFIVLILVIAIKWISQSRKTTLGMGGGQYRQLLTPPLTNRPQIVPESPESSRIAEGLTNTISNNHEKRHFQAQ